MNNSIFGKFLLDNRKYCTNTKLVTEEWHLQKLLNSCSVQDVIYISKEALLVKQSKPSIKFDSPIHVGFFILERAKAFMYDLYYNKLKRHYGDQLRLLYSDTDSFLLKFTDHDFMYEAAHGELRHYMDRSNFPKDHK